MGRRRKSRKSPVTLDEQILELFKAYGSFSHLNQCPGHIADHVMQESIALNRQEQTKPFFLQLTPEYMADSV